jgi:hypothetical protein
MVRIAAALVAIICWAGLAIQSFIDVDKLGWTHTLLNAGGIALAFLLVGLLLVWVDRWWPLGSGRSSR